MFFSSDLRHGIALIYETVDTNRKNYQYGTFSGRKKYHTPLGTFSHLYFFFLKLVPGDMTQLNVFIGQSDICIHLQAYWGYI